jgi:hypothetical protein
MSDMESDRSTLQQQAQNGTDDALEVLRSAMQMCGPFCRNTDRRVVASESNWVAKEEQGEKRKEATREKGPVRSELTHL